MWQDVFAVDSRVCEARFENMSAENKRDLKPLYLKRRLQLLQASHLHGQQRLAEAESSQQQDIENMSDKNKTIDRQGANTGSYQPVMKNKRYISLRVKLLKRQFGLPADVLSLKSLSLSSICRKNFKANTSIVPGNLTYIAHSLGRVVKI